MVQPLLERIRAEDLDAKIRTLIDLLDSKLTQAASGVGSSWLLNGYLLTLREIRICEMISSGLTSKEIAKVMVTVHQEQDNYL